MLSCGANTSTSLICLINIELTFFTSINVLFFLFLTIWVSLLFKNVYCVLCIASKTHSIHYKYLRVQQYSLICILFFSVIFTTVRYHSFHSNSHYIIIIILNTHTQYTKGTNTNALKCIKWQDKSTLCFMYNTLIVYVCTTITKYIYSFQ